MPYIKYKSACLFSIHDLANLIGLPYRKTWVLVSKGQLSSPKKKAGRRWYYDEKQLEIMYGQIENLIADGTIKELPVRVINDELKALIKDELKKREMEASSQ